MADDDAKLNPNNIRIPPRLSLLRLFKAYFKGGVGAVLALLETRISEVGIDLNKPLTLADVYGLLYTLGWFAPAGEWVPPAHTVVENYSKFVDVPASATIGLRFCAPGWNGVLKMKEFGAAPENLTARNNVIFELEAEGLSLPTPFATLPFFYAPGDCDDFLGTFSLTENITLPKGVKMVLRIINTDNASVASVHVFGKFWRLP
jgi:hypothetical protein